MTEALKIFLISALLSIIEAKYFLVETEDGAKTHGDYSLDIRPRRKLPLHYTTTERGRSKSKSIDELIRPDLSKDSTDSSKEEAIDELIRPDLSKDSTDSSKEEEVNQAILAWSFSG